MIKLVQIFAGNLLVAIAFSQLLDPINEYDKPSGLITLNFRLKFEALWDQEATLDEINEFERQEYVEEALIEIGSKMKRKHKQKGMRNFNILDRQNEIVQVAYPDLKQADGSYLTDDQLKDLALQILTTGVVNTINVFRDSVPVDVFDLEENQRKASEKFKYYQENRELTEDDIAWQKERDAKRKKIEDEWNEALEQQRKDQEELEASKHQMVSNLQTSYNDMNEKMMEINEMINNLS